MIIIDRGKCKFYIKEESIILEYSNQYISYNVYALQSRKKFKDFKIELLDSHRGQYNNINDVLGLAMKHDLVGSTGYKPTISENDIIIR